MTLMMKASKNLNVIFVSLLSLVMWLPYHAKAAFTFETCNDWGSTFKGNCTIIPQDGPLGSESGNTVWIQDGYLDYGSFWSGCPYKINTCQTGFSFYGWMKFRAYPKNCTDFGVIVSTEVFNLILRGNGHLAVYAWLADGTEFYAESPQPVVLDIWQPVIVLFEHVTTTMPTNDYWKLSLYAQGQLIAFTTTNERRTYSPSSSNLIFGGSGNANGDMSKNISVQLDAITLDYTTHDLTTIYQTLLNIYLRQAYCAGKYGIQPNALTCYWVETGALNWKDAYSSCSKNAYNYGFPYSRLARFPNWNNTVWNEVTKRMAYYGNGSNGYTAWIGGGKQMQWLDASMNPIRVEAVPPEGVTVIRSDVSSNSTCLQVNTKTLPWQWSEALCSATQYYICEMSFDCLLNNPCKNFGVCQPNNNGNNMCSCWPGTSGQFCEIGTPTSSCRSDCQSCALSGGLRVPDNCASCRTKLQTLLSSVTQLEVKLKLQLITLNIDIDQAEWWQSHVMDEFYNFTKTLPNNINGFDVPECDMVWNIYTKSRVHEKVTRKFIRKIQSISTTLPPDITTLWQTVNRTKDELQGLKCFNDIMANVKIFDNLTRYDVYFSDNHTTDNLWLKTKFKDEAMSGQSNTGLMYFGDMKKKMNSTTTFNNTMQTSNSQPINSNSNNQNNNIILTTIKSTTTTKSTTTKSTTTKSTTTTKNNQNSNNQNNNQNSNGENNEENPNNESEDEYNIDANSDKRNEEEPENENESQG